VAVRLPQGAELTLEQAEQAARVVADRAVSVADARDLLEMLGLVDAPKSPAVPAAGRHGTYPCYTAGCRCVECTRANASYHRRYMNRTKPGGGSR
jgi:hypothetical protein